MKIINIGIIAHVDAGKTTVTEQLLAYCGVIPRPGRVDHGNAVTDTLTLEKKRGISIKATPVSFRYGEVKINLIDTPGHADFISEVERSLSVLDGAVLVVSAREGVQPQTRLFIKVIRDLKLPCVVFINKADRTGSDTRRVFNTLNKAFGSHAVLMQDVQNEGTREIRCITRAYCDLYAEAAETLCDLHEGLMRLYVNGQPIEEDIFHDAVKELARRGMLYPVITGSALQSTGIAELAKAVCDYLPEADGRVDRPLSGVVFKVDAREAERKVYVRLYNGRIRVRDTLSCGGKLEKITRLKRMDNGKIIPADNAEAGDVCILPIKDLHVGDAVGDYPEAARRVKLARPALDTRIDPVKPADNRRLFEVLTAMADEDPLIALDSKDGELHISLFGEVQLEILQTTLTEEYGLDVTFSEPQAIYLETPSAVCEAVIHMSASHFAAGVGLRIEPLPRDAGLHYRSDVWLGSLEKPFQNAVEEAVLTACKKGLQGLPITDALVIFTYSEYNSVDSTPSDYRQLTQQVLVQALQSVGTSVLEPLMDFELVCPETAAGRALFDCRRMNAEIAETTTENGSFTITGLVPFVACQGYPLTLAAFTEGEGVFITRLHGYREKTAVPIHGNGGAYRKA